MDNGGRACGIFCTDIFSYCIITIERLPSGGLFFPTLCSDGGGAEVAEA